MGIFASSVVVREDKKLLTVLFPDGRDGRAFTLKVLHLIIRFLAYSFNWYIVFTFTYNINFSYTLPCTPKIKNLRYC